MLCASRHPNLSLLAEDGAVLGTLDRDWHNNDGSAHPLHGLSARFEPAATEGQTARNTFLLGDFKKLGEFLAYQLNRSDDHVSPATA